MHSLSSDQRAALYISMEARLPGMITQVDDFRKIRNYLSPEQCTALWSEIEARLPELIGSVDDFHWILEHLSPEQCNALCAAMEARLHFSIQTIIDNNDKIKLSPESFIAVAQALDRMSYEKNFFQVYKWLYQTARNGFFGLFRRSTCNPQWSLNEILHDAKTHNNRCREACMNLCWMERNGELSNAAPRTVRLAYYEGLQNPIVHSNGPLS